MFQGDKFKIQKNKTFYQRERKEIKTKREKLKLFVFYIEMFSYKKTLQKYKIYS